MTRFLVPILCLAALAAGFGLDYLSQRKAAGATLSASAYFQTVSERHAQYKASLVRHSVAKYMPAPSGWTKRDYTDADKARLMPAPVADPNAEPKLDLSSNKFAQAQRAQYTKGLKTAKAVYESGEAVVGVYTQYLPEHLLDGVSGLIFGEVASFEQLMKREGYSHFATIQGVPFVVDHNFEGPSRRIRASLTQQIRIVVQAIGTDEEILQVLSTFDFANLNLMVEEPLDYVGQPDSQTFLASSPDKVFAVPEVASLAVDEKEEAEEAPSSTTPGMLKGFLTSLVGGGESEDAELAEVNQAELTRTVTCETNHLGKRCVITYE